MMLLSRFPSSLERSSFIAVQIWISASFSFFLLSSFCCHAILPLTQVKYSDDAIPSEIGAKSDPEPEDNSSFGVEEESSGGRHAIDESEYEKQKRLIHGTPCNLPKGQKASERARKNAEDDGYELEEGKTYRVTHQMDVWCKKKNEE